MLPFNLNIPEYSSTPMGTYTNAPTNPMSITSIPQFDGYTFDQQSGRYYQSKGNQDNFLNKLFGRDLTAEQLNKMQGNKDTNQQFEPMSNLPMYNALPHQYNALSNMLTPNDVMTMMTSAGYNPSGAGRFANTAYSGGLLGKK